MFVCLKNKFFTRWHGAGGGKGRRETDGTSIGTLPLSVSRNRGATPVILLVGERSTFLTPRLSGSRKELWREQFFLTGVFTFPTGTSSLAQGLPSQVQGVGREEAPPPTRAPGGTRTALPGQGGATGGRRDPAGPMGPPPAPALGRTAEEGGVSGLPRPARRAGGRDGGRGRPPPKRGPDGPGHRSGYQSKGVRAGEEKREGGRKLKDRGRGKRPGSRLQLRSFLERDPGGTNVR